MWQNIGENKPTVDRHHSKACDDRCAIKYMETQTIIAETIKKFNEKQMRQQGGVPGG